MKCYNWIVKIDLGKKWRQQCQLVLIKLEPKLKG